MEELEHKQNSKFNALLRLFPYFLTIILIVLPWFLKSGYIFLTDMAWGPNITLDWSNSWFLFYFLIKSLSFLFPVAILEKLAFSGSLLIILLGGRSLVAAIFRRINAQNVPTGLLFIVSLFALLNPFVYDRVLYGQLGVLLAYGLTLFVGARLLIAEHTLDWKHFIVASVFGALALPFSIHFILILGLLYLLFFACAYMKLRKLAEKNNKHLWRAILASIIIVAAINTNWLIPFAMDTSTTKAAINEITPQDLSVFKTAGHTSAEIISNVFLMSGFWGKDQQRYMDIADARPNWGRSFFLLFPLIILGCIVGLCSREKNKGLFWLTAGLMLIYASAFILALGVSTQFSSKISLWLFDNMPFYKGMREPQKWVSLIIFVYLIFLTIGTESFFKRATIKKNQLFFQILLLFVLILQAPYLFWGAWGQITPVNYPQDWREVNAYLSDPYPPNKCPDKVLFLPWHLYMSFSWIGKVSANPATVFFSCPTISGTNMEAGPIYDNSNDPVGKKVFNWILHRGDSDMLAYENIKYIILAKEVDWSAYAWIDLLPNVSLIQDKETLRLYKIIQ